MNNKGVLITGGDNKHYRHNSRSEDKSMEHIGELNIKYS
jgi:hypothetical protein